MSAVAPHPSVLAVGSSEHDRHVRLHRHVGPELIYTVTGTSTSRCAGHPEALPGRPGLLQAIPAGALHDQRRLGMGRTIYVILRPFPGYELAQPQVFDVGSDSCEARWMADLLRLAEDARRAEAAVAQGHLLMALLTCLQARLRWVEHRHPPAVDQTVAAIRRTLMDDISVPALARSVGLSPSRLSALCRKHLGCAPLQYQQRLRMELACSLLRDPYLRIAEVGRRCGYADPAYFDRVFRRHHGCAPGAWRAQQGAGAPQAQDATRMASGPTNVGPVPGPTGVSDEQAHQEETPAKRPGNFLVRERG